MKALRPTSGRFLRMGLLAWLVALGLALFLPAPVYADDCLWEPWNLADCLRTQGFREVYVAVLAGLGVGPAILSQILADASKSSLTEEDLNDLIWNRLKNLFNGAGSRPPVGQPQSPAERPWHESPEHPLPPGVDVPIGNSVDAGGQIPDAGWRAGVSQLGLPNFGVLPPSDSILKGAAAARLRQAAPDPNYININDPDVGDRLGKLVDEGWFDGIAFDPDGYGGVVPDSIHILPGEPGTSTEPPGDAPQEEEPAADEAAQEEDEPEEEEEEQEEEEGAKKVKPATVPTVPDVPDDEAETPEDAEEAAEEKKKKAEEEKRKKAAVEKRIADARELIKKYQEEAVQHAEGLKKAQAAEVEAKREYWINKLKTEITRDKRLYNGLVETADVVTSVGETAVSAYVPVEDFGMKDFGKDVGKAYLRDAAKNAMKIAVERAYESMDPEIRKCYPDLTTFMLDPTGVKVDIPGGALKEALLQLARRTPVVKGALDVAETVQGAVRENMAMTDQLEQYMKASRAALDRTLDLHSDAVTHRIEGDYARQKTAEYRKLLDELLARRR